MPEATINLTGKKAVIGIVILMGVVVVRIATFADKKGDSALMRELEVQLASDYFPNETAKLQAAYESGDANKLENAAKAVTTAKLNIESVQASSPLFDFSMPKDVVVKVTYSLNDDSGTRDRKTKYYLFNHGLVGNIWEYEYESSVVSFYLNFL